MKVCRQVASFVFQILSVVSPLAVAILLPLVSRMKRHESHHDDDDDGNDDKDDDDDDDFQDLRSNVHLFNKLQNQHLSYRWTFENTTE